MVKFNIVTALNNLVQGARFRGTVVEHTQAEYDNLEQFDPRDKPQWSEIFEEALKEMRRDIMQEINRKTDNIIEWEMTFNDGTNTVLVHLGIEEQINLDTMDRLRDELEDMGMLTWPYELKVSDNEHGEGNYVRLMNANHLHQFFLMGVAHKNTAIVVGRHLKDNLSGMSKTELEEQYDPR